LRDAFEEQSIKNMALFFRSELLRVSRGQWIDDRTREILKMNRLVVWDGSRSGIEYVLTELGQELLGRR